MHRNTFILISALTLFAAIVVGVNISRRLNPAATTETQTVLPTPTPIQDALYESGKCGISFRYPAYLEKMDSAVGGIMLIDAQNPNRSIVLVCQKSIPDTFLEETDPEEYPIGTISATIYRPASESADLMTKIIIDHPTNTLKIFVSSARDVLDGVLSTLTFN